MRVDLKSLVLGGALALTLFVILGQATKPDKPIGRYEIIMPHTTSDIPIPFLLDTKEGLVYKFFININLPKGQDVGWSLCPMDSISFDVWESYR